MERHSFPLQPTTCFLYHFQSNELVIGSAGVKTRFLPEAELPECARLSSRTQNQEGNLEEALKESARMSEERQMQQALKVRQLSFFCQGARKGGKEGLSLQEKTLVHISSWKCSSLKPDGKLSSLNSIKTIWSLFKLSEKYASGQINIFSCHGLTLLYETNTTVTCVRNLCEVEKYV